MGLCKISLALSCLFGFALIGSSSAGKHHDSSPQEYLDPHNAAREAVGVHPLIWDNNVAAFAKKYAKERSHHECELEHSNGPYGENIAWKSIPEFSPAEAVNAWLSEDADYDYNSNTCAPGKECGHYTQVVSRWSLRLGCAKTRCKNGGTFMTCNYDPPGRVVGQRPY